MDEYEEFLRHRRAVAENINKAFDEELEKAHRVGDLFFQNGKTYVYTEYAPGQYDWHVVQRKSGGKILIGKGYGGLHGVRGVMKAFEHVDESFVDVNKMMLKRTPNGNWRLYYDDTDTGSTIDPDSFTEIELKEDNICYQDRRVVDNFELLKDYMEFNKPDDVYFVQIIKRWKDNKDKPNADAWKAAGKLKGSYHSGGEFLNYWLIASPADLDAHKAEIIKACNYNNARAYISINSRSKSQVDAYIDHFKSRYSPSDPRYKNAEAILYGQAKTGPSWRNERLRVLLDIDTTSDAKTKIPNGKTVNIWNETEKRLKDLNIKVAARYETPSGGLHLILNNKNNRNLREFYRDLKDFDGGQDLGRLSTVHPSEDIKMVLYSAVATEGY